MPDVDKHERSFYERRVSQMDTERSNFIPHYRSLAEFIKPRRGQFLNTSNSNRVSKSFSAIINSAGTRALRTSQAGMLAGIMSPTRPWFRLTTQNPELRQRHAVRVWLSQIEVLMREIFNSGNLYNMAPSMLGELLLFGTGCMTHVDDFEDVARFYTHTAGSYMISQNDRLVIDTLARQYKMTCEQMIREFGEKNVSQAAKDAYDRGNYTSEHDIVHFISPNADAKAGSERSRDKPFQSVKYEAGNPNKEQMLSQKGFDEFPAYVPRWETTAEDIYATNCPGMEALGDIKGLQVEEKRKAQGIDKQVNPPLQGPAEFKNVDINSLPGGVTIASIPPGSEGIRPLYLVNPDIVALADDINRVEFRIQQAFFVDLFLAITTMQGIQPRNERELSERNAERLLQLGPVLEQAHGAFLEPMIDRTFNQMARAQILPPIPPELSEQNLKVEFISSLALAQRAVQIGGIERFLAFLATIAEAGVTDALDKLNSDLMIDEYGDLNGVNPQFIVATEDAQKAREQRAKLQQQAMAMEQAQNAAAIASTAANSKLDDDNLLSRGVEQFQKANPQLSRQ